MNLKSLLHFNIFILPLLLLTLYHPFPAWGAEVHGSLALRGEYHDNIFLRADNELTDYRMTISPALSFIQEKSRNILEMEYSSRLIYHDEYSEQDTFSHSLSIIGESDPSRKISAGLNATDTYRFFYVDPSRIDQPTLIEDLAEGNTLRVNPTLRFRIGSTSRAIFGYQYANTYYKIDTQISDSDQWRDSEGHGGNFSWEQKLGSEIVLNLDYSYFIQQFERPLSRQYISATEYDDHQPQIGLRWQVSPEVTGGVSYGYIWREYDTGDQLEYPNWAADLTFSPTEATELQARYAQTLQDDVYGRSYEDRQGRLELSQGIGQRLNVTLGGSYRKVKYQLTDQTYEVWEGDIGLTAAISGKLSLGLSGSYQDWGYKTEDISQERYTAEGTLAYQLLDWLSFDIRYRYLESVSDTSAYEYIVNRYSVGLTAAF